MSDEPGGVFMQVPNDQLGRLSLIEAIRANTDAVQRLGRHTETQEHKLDRMAQDINEMKTNIALIQHSGLRPMVEEHDRRLALIEERENRRLGREGFLAGAARSPVVGWLAAIVAFIAAAVAWLKGAGQ